MWEVREGRSSTQLHHGRAGRVPNKRVHTYLPEAFIFSVLTQIDDDDDDDDDDSNNNQIRTT